MSKKIGKKNSTIISRLKGLVSVTETFDRSNGSLGYGGGTSSVPWKAVRGSWTIATNKANSAGNGSDYPLSTLTFTKDDAITLSVDGIGAGVGTAFWVTDSNNWWATYQDATQTCQTCYNVSNIATYVTNSVYVPASGGNCTANANACSYYNAGNPTGTYSVYYTNIMLDWPAPGTSCGYFGWTTVADQMLCGGGGGGNACCKIKNLNYNPGNCAAYYSYCTTYSTYYPAYSYNVSNASTYNASTSYSCNCTTGYSIKLIKNIAGTISNVATFSIASIAAGIKTVLNGTTVTVKAYSGAGYTSQIGSDQSTTVSGFTRTKSHGVIKAPVTYSPTQTSDIDKFEVA